jgi:hypothetical protein
MFVIGVTSTTGVDRGVSVMAVPKDAAKPTADDHREVADGNGADDPVKIDMDPEEALRVLLRTPPKRKPSETK